MSLSNECVLGGEQPRAHNKPHFAAPRLASALHPEPPMRAALTVLILLALVPPTASAVSLDQIVVLCRAGVPDDVVLALIDRDKSVFALEPEQLVWLKQAGVSEAVVLAMLRSGRQSPAQPDTASTILSAIGPEIIIVGHGPDAPNTAARNDYTAGFGPQAMAPYVLYMLVVPEPTGGCVAAGARNTMALPLVPGFGRFMSDPIARFTNNGFIPADGVTRSHSAVFDCQQPPTRPRLQHHR